MTRKAMGLIAVTAVMGLFAAVALSLSSSASSAQAQAPDATITVSSANIVPGGATDCPYNPPGVGEPDPVEATCIIITVTPEAGVSVGTIGLDLTYDDTLVDVTDPFYDPTNDPGVIQTTKGVGVCNATANPINCQVASTAALGGTWAAIEFTSIAGEGTSPLTLSNVTCSNTLGEPLNCATTNGQIVIAQATPTPTPVPATPTPTPAPATPTATPTATPAGLPQTGGTSSDGSSSELLWVLGTLGLAVLAGGVWAVSRARRQSV